MLQEMIMIQCPSPRLASHVVAVIWGCACERKRVHCCWMNWDNAHELRRAWWMRWGNCLEGRNSTASQSQCSCRSKYTFSSPAYQESIDAMTHFQIHLREKLKDNMSLLKIKSLSKGVDSVHLDFEDGTRDVSNYFVLGVYMNSLICQTIKRLELLFIEVCGFECHWQDLRFLFPVTSCGQRNILQMWE